MQELFCSKYYSECPRKCLKIFSGVEFVGVEFQVFKHICKLKPICYIARYKMLNVHSSKKSKPPVQAPFSN